MRHRVQIGDQLIYRRTCTQWVVADTDTEGASLQQVVSSSHRYVYFGDLGNDWQRVEKSGPSAVPREMRPTVPPPAAGRKDDTEKLPLELLPHDALIDVARVMQHGAQKYGARNWERGIHYSRLYGAALRHLVAWWRGEDLDPETQRPHLAHAACEVLFLLAFAARERTDLDNRPAAERVGGVA